MNINTPLIKGGGCDSCDNVESETCESLGELFQCERCLKTHVRDIHHINKTSFYYPSTKPARGEFPREHEQQLIADIGKSRLKTDPERVKNEILLCMLRQSKL